MARLLLVTMRILISGSLAYDKIMEYSGCFSDHIMPGKIHTLNLSFVTENLREHFGGTAGNIAYGLALLEEKPAIFASAGQDFGHYRDWLVRAGVDLNFVRNVSDKSTTVSHIMTDNADNQIASVFIGAMAYPCEIKPENIPTDAFAIISPGNIEDMRRLPALYREKNIPFIFDPGQQIPALSAEEIRNGITGAKAFISNDYELALALDKIGWTEKDILARAEMMVTTLGKSGSRICTREKTMDVPPARIKLAIDPTGAGDAYRAGFIKGLLMSWPLEVAGRFAGVISAYAVEVNGTQEYRFTLAEARARYAQSFGAELPA